MPNCSEVGDELWKVLLYYYYTNCFKNGLWFFLQANEVGFFIQYRKPDKYWQCRALKHSVWKRECMFYNYIDLDEC